MREYKRGRDSKYVRGGGRGGKRGGKNENLAQAKFLLILEIEVESKRMEFV